CSSDGNCPGSERCCSTGCGRECRLPAEGPAASNGPVSLGDICYLPPVPGPCKGRFLRYAYNPATGTCQPFTYGGCGGNPNNFRMVKECQQVC
ncbi:EPPI protein, partial [Chloroceryle aenea]|nr:EPPI protein [Chloroceryle aenea]